MRRNAVVLAWFAAAAALAVGVLGGPLAAWGTWLPLHTLLLGGVGSAITIWSAHFADTLLHRPALGGAALLDARLYAHSLGAIAVLTGISTGAAAAALAGVSVIVTAALAGVAAIGVQYRRALAPAMASLVIHYLAALGALAAGAVLGYLISWVGGRGVPRLADALYLAHTITMLWGFVGITVLGTLPVLWPTMLRTRMEPTAARRASRGLPLLVVGTAVTASSGAWLPAAGIGTVVYLAGAATVVVPAAVTARRVPPTSFATMSAAAAVAWLLAGVGYIGAGIVMAEDVAAAREVIHTVRVAMGAGFALQIVAAALSYLTPVMLGGGPAVVRGTNAILDRAAAWRVVSANLCLLLAVVQEVPCQVRLAGAVGAGLVAAYVPVGIGLAVRRVMRGGSRVPGDGAGSGKRLDRRGVLLGLLATAATAAAGAGVAAWRAALAARADDQDTTATGRTTAATVTVEGMRFVPDTVDVAVGDRLVLTLDNTGDQVHDLVLQLEDGSTVSTGRVAAGDTGSLDAGVVPGPLEGWCSIAGHRAQGMVLHVTASGQGGQAPSAGTTADPSDDVVPDYSAALPGEVEPFDAALAPADTSATVHEHTLTVTEREMYVGGGVTQRRMSYNGQVPGPVLRGKVGDTFRITLVNSGSMSHSIDFHAGVISPDEVMRSIDPGDSLVYEFTAQRSGIWLYHCSTAPMSVHLASGMHGAVIIDPPGLTEADREYVMIQSEIYLGPAGGGTDADKVSAKAPDLLAFNGVAFQYRDRPLIAKAGERVRFWVLDAGPSLPTSFHAVGLQFDQVFSEGAWTLGGPEGVGGAWSGGGQALDLQPAQGGFVECVPPAPGTYALVSHAFADMEKGAMGCLRVSA